MDLLSDREVIVMALRLLHEINLQLLALCCLYVQAGRAKVYFPGTSKASPSEWVVVERNGLSPLRDGDSQFFPCRIPWDLWQNVAVPLLTGEENLTGTTTTVTEIPQTINDIVFPQEFSRLLNQWAIQLKLRIDPSLSGMSLNSEDLSNLIGEPIIRGSTEGETGYPVLDPQLAWIEGHKRLEYPEVN